MNTCTRRIFLRNSAITATGLALSQYSFSQPTTDYTYLSIAEVSELVRRKEVSPVELTKACLRRIERLNPKLNAFITVTAESALKEAAATEKAIRKGNWNGPLHGIPIALKDNIDTAGVRTTAASGVYRDRVPAEDAEVTTLLKNAGAIILGKLNMHEFAGGTTSLISYFGSVHNPWNIDYITSGSSGGSAAAVAAGLCYGAMGTDTAGSSRLPPACCGVVGLKATYNLISIRGIIPLAQSLDHACPICRTVEDAAIMLNVLANHDWPQGSCTTDYRRLSTSTNNQKIGIVRLTKASQEVKASFLDAVRTLEALGYTTSEVDMPKVPGSFSSIFNDEVEAYHQPLLKQYKDLYQPETSSRLVNIKGTSSADYINAKNEMDTDRRSISAKLFQGIEVLISPTITTAASSIAEASKSRSFDFEYTLPFNYYGLPAITIPCGFSESGLPLGLQIVGPKWGEGKVLDIAYQYQKATPWHLKHPNITY